MPERVPSTIDEVSEIVEADLPSMISLSDIVEQAMRNGRGVKIALEIEIEPPNVSPMRIRENAPIDRGQIESIATNL